jgi:hypothetical protein
MKKTLLIALLVGYAASCADAQVVKSSRWLNGLNKRYTATLDLVYNTVDTVSDRLDVYVPKNASTPAPVLLWIHGGDGED